MTFEEAYQQIRKHHYEILDERESISKSARLSLSTWVLDILTECRDTADTPQTDIDTEEFVKGMKNLKMEVKQTDCPWK